MDDESRAAQVREARAAYAARRKASPRAASPGRDTSPRAVEATLASISEEVTDDAIERRRDKGSSAEADTANLFSTEEGLNMIPQHANRSDADLGSEAVEEMAIYGIKCVQISQFSYGDYRYTNLADAVAEAKRHPRKG